MSTKVSALPSGYHSITPHLITAEASRVIEFLQQVFDGVERFRLADPKGRILHAEVAIGDSVLMLAEATEERRAMPASFAVYVDEVDSVYRRAVEAGATSMREPADQFYGDRTAGVQDLAGNHWWIATHVETVSPDEIKLRAERWMKERTHVRR